VFPLLVVLFLLLPLAELWVIVQVADGAGIGTTIVLLLAISVAGAWLLKQQGWSALRRAQATLGQGTLPTSALLDGALIVLGGALLLTPGFITDAVGFSLLLPPSRAVVRKLLAARFAAKIQVVGPTGTGAPRADGFVDVDGHDATTPERRPDPPQLES
jgi:UPF0716 protein FxsA